MQLCTGSKLCIKVACSKSKGADLCSLESNATANANATSS